MSMLPTPLLRLAVAVATIAGGAIATVPSAPASADGITFVVDTLSDNAADGNTLREAVADANATPGPDTVSFLRGLAGTIVLTGGTIVINGSLTVIGPLDGGITIDGDGASNIFVGNTPNADHALRGLRFTGGSTLGFGGAVAYSNSSSVLVEDVEFIDNQTALDGGGLFVDGVSSSVIVRRSSFADNASSGTGGGLYINSTNALITLADTEFENNSSLANAGGFAALSPGGAILVERVTAASNESGNGDAGGAQIDGNTAVLTDSTFSDNTADDSFGGVLANSTSGDLIVTSVVATGNTAADTAGAAFFSSADLDITDTRIEMNTSPGTGGMQVSAAGDIEITSSRVSSNEGDIVGGLSVSGAGGLTITETDVSANVGGTIGGATVLGVPETTITRSTFSFNIADFATGIGGGLWITGGNDLSVDNSTFANNRANDGAGIYSTGVDVHVQHGTIVYNLAADEAGGIFTSSADLDIADTILTGNEAATFPDSNDTNLEISHSILGSGAGLNLIGSNVQVGVDPMLNLIDDNGGPTRTILPIEGSPAIDAAADKPAILGRYLDQRGRFRPLVGSDIGAVETAYDSNRIWTPVEPGRFVDTRASGETIDGLYEASGPIAAGDTMEIEFAGRGAVPANALGVIANVTAVNPDGNGFFTSYPCGGPQPVAASLNYTAGVTLGNEVILTFDDETELDSCIFSSSTTNFTVDVVGYLFGGGVRRVDPTRYLDTRPGGLTFDGMAQGAGRPEAGSTTRVKIGDRGPVSSFAQFAVIYVAAVNPLDGGFVTVWDCEGDAPLASSLNHVAGVNRGNEIITRLGDTGDVCIFTSSDVHLTVDVVGSIGPGTNLTMLDAPGRLLDTRLGGATVDGVAVGDGSIAAGMSYELPVAGRAGILRNAETVAINVTAINPAAPGFVTVFDCDGLPLASSLNYVPGVNGGNEIIASVNAEGNICLHTSAATHLAVDVTGFTSP